MQKNIVYHTS